MAQSLYDFTDLAEATKSLLGYFVHTWYLHYLGLIVANFRRLQEHGMLKSLTEPTPLGAALVFDFSALDIEKITYINGIYFYILSCHKNANWRLMNRHEGKQVLYLRGFDIEASLSAGGNMAVGVSSVDATQFNWKLGKLLAHDCSLFKILSPKDVYWETVDAQRHFYGDFEGMIRLAGHPMRSIYLNAARWQEGVTALLDRMDHFVVYVSSTTASAIWEIEQLIPEDRRSRVTVVFDEKAIETKKMQEGYQDKIVHDQGDHVIWSKQAHPLDLNVSQFRELLAQKFLVTSPQEFEANIEEHRRGIQASSGPLGPGARETSFDFDFRPALDLDKLNELRDFSASIQSEVEASTGAKGIVCLPLFLNLVQLRTFMTLLLGEHADTGRALAAYAAVIEGAQEYYTRPGPKPGDLSEEGRERNLKLLEDHLGMAQHIGSRMLSYGKSSEFGNYSKYATAEFAAEHDRTKTAVDRFFTEVASRPVEGPKPESNNES